MRRGFLQTTTHRTVTRRTSEQSTPTVATGDKDESHVRLEIPSVPLDVGNLLPSHEAPIICTLPPNCGPNEPVTTCLIWPSTKELILSTLGFPQAPRPPPTEPAYRLGDSPGKGLGLFATRALKQGDLILNERALLLTTLAPPYRRYQHGHTQFEQYMEVVVAHMPPGNKEALMTLTNNHDGNGCGPIHGRIRTNGCSVSRLRPGKWPGLEGKYSAVLEKISRLNHCCSPNTQSRFDRFSVSHSLFAVRDIAEGEELTNNYSNLLDSTAERAKDHRSYGRRRLKELDASAAQWIITPTYSDDWLIRKCLEQLVIMEKENLQAASKYLMAMTMLLIAFVCLGDSKSASVWAARLKKLAWWGEVEHAKVDELLDPKSPAYAKRLLWRTRVDRAKGWKLFEDDAQVKRAFTEFLDPSTFEPA
uniref:SET domain-containing protein n=1 Tax=Mycena chlorophos TaxID=658473 RepID=A0ABQ0LYR6_MYCCL|nr:predicted protein [Mycena chlorophos]